MKQSGFVLWMVLTCLSLMSMLALAQLEMLMNYQKALQAIALKHTHRRMLEQLAAAILQENIPLGCVRPRAVSPDDSAMLLNEGSTCHLQQHHKIYDYVFENLGIQPCLQIRHHPTVFSTQHWRLTLAARDHRNLILQIHYIQSAPYQRCSDENAIIWTFEGVKSWRMI